ncbi:hypothetical protein APHAL10511_000847 [Amanita phalloides]|nr:hypothetical protein APHAL10511_000847 [Amanita phalloides]
MQAPQLGSASQLDGNGKLGLWLRIGKQMTDTSDGPRQLALNSLQDHSPKFTPMSKPSEHMETTPEWLRDDGKDAATTMQQTLSSDAFIAWKKSWASNSSPNTLLWLPTSRQTIKRDLPLL